MTTAPMRPAAAAAASEWASSGRPASATKAFGPPAPSLCPEPAAAMMAVAVSAEGVTP